MTRLDSAIRRLHGAARRARLGRWRVIRPCPDSSWNSGSATGAPTIICATRLPGREIYVFERAPAAHPDCMPPPDRLVVGDILADAAAPSSSGSGAHSAVLIHADIGTGDEDRNGRLALRLSPLVEPLLAPRWAARRRPAPSICPTARTSRPRPGSSAAAISCTGGLRLRRDDRARTGGVPLTEGMRGKVDPRRPSGV